MSDFAARIGRIRMKDGGAEVRVLHSRPGPDGGDDWRGAVVRNARAVAEFATEEAPLVGYLLIGFYDDGTNSVGFRYDSNNRNAIPTNLIPAWTAEIIRRHMIVDAEASDKARTVFNEMFEWREG